MNLFRPICAVMALAFGGFATTPIPAADLTVAFEAAVSHVRSLNPTQEQTLMLYAYSKQATEGPCNTDRPTRFAFEKIARWDAWSALGDMSKEEAMQSYIALLASMEQRSD